MNTMLQIAILIAATAANANDARHPTWIAGDWGDVATGSAGEPECGDHTITYFADGYYGLVDQTGTWTYRDGQICTRILIEDGGTQSKYSPGPLECQQVRRTSGGIATRWQGHWLAMERCGNAERLDARTRGMVDRAEKRRLATKRRQAK